MTMQLSPHVPDLAGLQLLLAVARTGSINAAGGELGITQQAASQRMRALEARTGLALLARGPHGSMLTESGGLLAGWAAEVLDAAGRLDVAIGSLRQDRRAQLRLAASLTLAEHLVPGWLVALAASERTAGATATRVQLTAENSAAVCRSVLAGSADLGFVESPTVDAQLRTRVVATDELIVLTRPDHPWAGRRQGISAAVLAATPLVSREQGSGTRNAWLQALAQETGLTSADPVAEYSSSAAVRAAVLAGAGPTVLSELAVTEDLATGRLVRIPVRGLAMVRQLRAVWVGGSTPPAGPARDLVAIALRQGRTARV